MVPRENLEESVVRTGRDFPAGGNPCLSKGLTSFHALQLGFIHYLPFTNLDYSRVEVAADARHRV